MSKREQKVRFNGDWVIARTEREQILVATYGVAIKTLGSKAKKADVVRWMNTTFETDFSLREVLEFVDLNTPHEDYELESRKHQMKLK